MCHDLPHFGESVGCAARMILQYCGHPAVARAALAFAAQCEKNIDVAAYLPFRSHAMLPGLLDSVVYKPEHLFLSQQFVAFWKEVMQVGGNFLSKVFSSKISKYLKLFRSNRPETTRMRLELWIL